MLYIPNFLSRDGPLNLTHQPGVWSENCEHEKVPRNTESEI